MFLKQISLAIGEEIFYCIEGKYFPLLEVELHAFIYCNYSATGQNGILVPLQAQITAARS